MPSDDTTALDVFFSYSHRDESLRDELETHLALLKHDRSIRTWHDRRIGAGLERESEIDRRLDSADLVLLRTGAKTGRIRWGRTLKEPGRTEPRIRRAESGSGARTPGTSMPIESAMGRKIR